MITSIEKGIKATIFIIVGITFSFNLKGQNCECMQDSILKNLISCDPIKFDNNTELFWSFNCDSSWLTFVDKHGKLKEIFSLGDGLVSLTGRLGYIYAFEYDNTFLIQNNVISGCCSPPDYYLYDKSTGHLKRKLGRIIFYSKDKTNPYVISITNSTYDETNDGKYKSLTLYNIEKDKTSFIELPAEKIANALDSTEQMYPEFLFNKPVISGDSIILTYYLRKPKDDSDKPVETITINIKK